MTTADILQVFSTLVAVLATILALFANMRKLPMELRSSDVDLATKLRAFATEETDKRIAMKKEVETLENKIDSMELQVKETTEKLLQLEDWTRRLCAQLISQGITPVPLIRDTKESR